MVKYKTKSMRESGFSWFVSATDSCERPHILISYLFLDPEPLATFCRPRGLKMGKEVLFHLELSVRNRPRVVGGGR